MCATCGCDQPGGVTITKIGDEETIFQPVSEHSLLRHHLVHQGDEKRRIDVEEDILSKNNNRAKHNRHHFDAGHMLAINLVSSPGSGKTSLLERTLKDTKSLFTSYVIEGDQQSMNDAKRIAATGAEVVQINTGKGCHLDADMVHSAIHELNPEENSIVFIENVGNLVCPALFDLGEHARVAIISVTEGDDKPLKYPDIFASSLLCIINKIDLLPYVKFDVQKVKDYALRANPNLTFIELSAVTGEGMKSWYQWLKTRFESVQEEYAGSKPITAES